MSGEPAIRAEEIGKRYRIGRAHGQSTFAETLTSIVKNPRSWRDGAEDPEVVWALRDISFEVTAGEVVGFIGRNGAGKSTLLKILSRITEPTTGRARIYGRVGSLLEVGTGFHPELTGRENVFLNGSVLGMSRREIAHAFDEIVEFSEVGSFIDTPVKRYSSGMYVRLAFSVAAHLLPEILIIDEVLAVGDVSFVRKCLGRLGDVAHSGRTVLFVSHNMVTVQQLCTKVFLLEDGRIVEEGGPSAVTSQYLARMTTTSLRWDRSEDPRPGIDAYFESIYLVDGEGAPAKVVTTASTVTVEMDVVLLRDCRDLQLVVSLDDAAGEPIIATVPPDAGVSGPQRAGRYHVSVRLPPEALLGLTYGVRACLYYPNRENVELVDQLRFTVEEVASFATSPPGGRAGRLALPCEWRIESASDGDEL